MRNLTDLIADIRKRSSDIQKLEKNMAKIIGVESVKIIRNNFQIQGYETGGTWAKRKQVTNTAYDYNRTAAYRTPKLGKRSRYKNPYKGSVVSSKNPVLVQTGNLRDSITYQINGKIISIGVFPNFIKAGAKVASHTYVKKMNEGGPGTWGKYARTSTTARQFMPRPGQPPTKKMELVYIKAYEAELNRIMGDWR
jgi:hypothetical protein